MTVLMQFREPWENTILQDLFVVWGIKLE